MLIFMENNAIFTGVTTISTALIMDRFGINNSFYGIIFTTILGAIKVMSDFDIDTNIVIQYYGQFLNVISDKYFAFYVICGILLIGMYYYDVTQLMKYIVNYSDRQYNVYDIDTILIISKYMSKHSENFTTKYDVRIGHDTVTNALMDMRYCSTVTMRNWLRQLNSISIPTTSQTISINDTKFNFKGNIIWHNRDLELKGTNCGSNGDSFSGTVKFKYLTIKSNDNNINEISKYIDKITHYMTHDIHLKLISYKIVTECNDRDKLNDGNMSFASNHKVIGDLQTYCMKTMEKNHIDSFFHPNKVSIWNSLKKIKTDPDAFLKFGQIPAKNILAYGPPGTGKSTFAYRIAQTLGRNIIEVDLKIIKSKQHLYSLFESPVLTQNNMSGNLSPSNVVYILDEFDRTVEYLYNKQKEAEEYEKEFKNYMTYGGEYNSYSFNTSENTGSNKQNMIKEDESDNDCNTNNGGGFLKLVSTGTEKKSPLYKTAPENKSKNSNAKNKTEEQPSSAYDMSGLILKDLLDVFQGPVPVEGRIIIATTNYYDRIKKICPELFRPGRMTPIKFDYPTKEIVQEISKYYFDKELDIDLPSKLETPISNLIEICMEAHSNNYPYEYFVNKMNQLVKELDCV